MASNVPIDVALTNISVAAFQDAKGFIASRVFPVVPVEQQSGLYYKWDEEDLNRDTAQRRADATESAGDGYEIGQDKFYCDPFALHKDVGDQMQSNFKNAPGTPFAGAARFIVNKMLIRQEVQFASDFLKTGVWGTDITGVSGTPGAGQVKQWNDDAADPIQDVENWKQAIFGATGLWPNKLVLGYQAFSAAKNHPSIVDRFKYTTSDNATADILARLFEVDEVLVASALVNTAKKGQAAVNTPVFSKGALFVHAADTPGIDVPSAGYIFQWSDVSDGLGETIGTKQFRMEHLAADRVESTIAFDDKLVSAPLGLLVSSLVA